MAGSFDAKVEISTADAVNNLRNLKREVKENAAQFRDFNKAIQESKQNVVLAAQQMTKLAQARRQNAIATKEETANTIAAARATAIETTGKAKAAELDARRANQKAQEVRAYAQEAAAIARTAAVRERSARATVNAATSNKVLTDNLSNTRYLMYDVGATLGVLSGALLAMPAATAVVAASYQKDFAQVLRVTEDLTNGGLELRNSLKDIARDIPIAFGELSRITQLGAQMGVAESSLASFTETTAKFVAVTGISADSASQLFGRLEGSFNPDKSIPDFFNKVGSAIAYVGAKTVATDPEIASMMNQIGSLGAEAGMTADETIGLAAALASVRVQPELARGTLTRTFGQLNRLAAEGGPVLENYGKVMGGISGDEAKAMWENDPSKFFTELIKGMNKTVVQGGNLTVLMDALEIKASRDVSALTKMAVGYDVLEKSMAASGQGFTEGTALDKMSEPVFDTVIAKLQKLANAWSNLADTLGGGSLAPLGVLVDGLAGFANGLDNIIQQAPGIGVVLSILMGFVAVTGIFMGMKAAQAFVLAGLISFQQAMGNRGVTAAMSFSGVLKEVGRTFMLLSGQAGAATVAINGQAAAANVATAANARLAGSAGATAAALGGKAVKGVQSFASGLLAMAGGPIGVALIALTSLTASLINTGIEAQDTGKKIAAGLKEGGDAAAAAAAEGFTKRKVELWDPIMVGNLGKNMREIAQESGVGFDKLVQAATKGKDAVSAIMPEFDRIARSKGFKDFQDMDNVGGNSAGAGKLRFLKRELESIANASVNSSGDMEATEKALGDLGFAAEDTAEDFKDATDPIEEMEKALKKLNDTIFGTLNAEANLQGSLRKLGEGLGDSGAFDTRSEGGRTNQANLQGAMEDAQQYYKQLMMEGTLTAQEAAQGYAQFIDGLIAQIRSTGGDPTPMIDLANQTKRAYQAALEMGAPPSVPVTTDKGQAAAAGTAAATTVKTVAEQVQAVVKVGADSSNADADILILAQNLATITGLPYQVVLDALTDPAHEKSKQVYDVITQITDGTYTAAVDADTTAAIANVKNFSAYAREELATLQAEYDSVLKMADTGKGFFKGSANIAVGRNWDGTGTTRARPGTVSSGAAVPKQVRAKAPALNVPDLNFGAVADGYKKVQDEAEKTKKKNKEVWQDMGDGIDEATSKINDYAARLKTGLTSAFDKQYGMSIATDAYHSSLNAITKKHEEELEQLEDMKEKVKELRNERDKDLIDANKAKIEQNISIKYGEVDRAMDYGNQKQTALDSAAAKQRDIDATNKQARELQDGIGKLTGFSQAAIDNRAALRDLETKMLDMVVAYANTGASIDQVRNYARNLTGQFQVDVGQMGLNQIAVAGMQGNLERYIGVVDRVPFLKPTKVDADTEEATKEIEAFGRLLDEATAPREAEVVVNVRTGKVEKVAGYFLGQDGKNGGQQVHRNRDAAGSKIGWDAYNRGGSVRVPGLATGGMVPGRPPQNPRADNMLAQVDGKGLVQIRSREFIQPEEAVDYYGENFMEAVRTLSLPKFNMGGSPGGSFGGGGSGTPVVGLDAETLSFLASLKQNIILQTENRVIAESANAGNRELAAEGRNR